MGYGYFFLPNIEIDKLFLVSLVSLEALVILAAQEQRETLVEMVLKVVLECRDPEENLASLVCLVNLV